MAMKFRVWHVPNPPRPGFVLGVGSVDEAIHVLDTLADIDLGSTGTVIDPNRYHGAGVKYQAYLIYQGIGIPDSNAQGLECVEDEEWVEYYDDEGRDISEIREAIDEAV